MNESGIVYEELQTLKKRNAVASSLFKAEKQDDASWIASAKETSGLSKRYERANLFRHKEQRTVDFGNVFIV